ncbi:MAG: hypothetical protein KJ626_06140 [Verrucomicrobia bacterium]|nr:hypothetical protein [Verrucomicrobiota bacterium]
MNAEKRVTRWQLVYLAVTVGMLCSGGGSALAEESLCARVVIEIQQELTLERQAFDAHMRINNGLANMTMEDVEINVVFRDGDGNAVIGTSNSDDQNAAFFIRLDSMENIDDVNGDGVVGPSTSADIHWLIIPSPGAGGEEPAGQLYFVGATLKYTIAGEINQMEVIPDSIMVLPMPQLALDYFIPEEVYGDDAFTEAIESPVPFTLGVRVKNEGYAAAKNVQIRSAQPRIVDNEQGLLIGFRIIGSKVNGGRENESLLVPFGDIEPEKARVGSWIMECTLSGRFVDMEAHFTHADELGGQLTSLISGTHSHLMIHEVLADLAGRDDIRDFLARDDDEVLRVYESDNVDSVVSNRTGTASLVLEGTDGDETTYYTLNVPPTPGAMYVQLPFAGGWNQDVKRVIRLVDGKICNEANVWIQKTRNEDNPEQWDWHLDLFDINGGGEYAIVLKEKPVAENQPPVLQYIGPKVVLAGDQIGFFTEASDPNNTMPVMTALNVPTNAVYVDNTNGTADFAWFPTEEDWGVHLVKFIASDGQFSDWEISKIYVGHAGEELNAQGIPLSLEAWNVEIKRIAVAASSGNVTVVWDAAEGVFYDLYYSDDPFSRQMGWLPVNSQMEGDGGEEDEADSGVENRDYRFYQVVLAGDTPDMDKVWGVIRKDVAVGFTMLAPPLRMDRSFAGELGAYLAVYLEGDDGGPGDSVGDEVYVLQMDGSWYVMYLDSQGIWRDGAGTPTTYELPEGRGFFVARHSMNPTELTFPGEVGNDGTTTSTIVPGWNLLSFSEGRFLPVQQTFIGAGAGGPVGGAAEENADQIVIQRADGSWRRMFFVEGWGAPYDGNWFDLDSYQITDYEFEPGTAVYYYRQPSGGQMDVSY